MQVFEKIIEKLEEKALEHAIQQLEEDGYVSLSNEKYAKRDGLYEAIEIVKQVATEYNNGWISCSKEMPPVETEVFILAKRKFKDGTFNYIRTMAMYEDGTISECDSCWYWEDIEGEYDEENDCYIIPKGWWESRKYNTKDSLNFAVDDEVIAWQPLPEPYNPEIKKETQPNVPEWKEHMMKRFMRGE